MPDAGWRAVASAHGKQYPLMEPQDAVKLLYQHEFGGGHLVREPEKALEFLEQEWSGLREEEKRKYPSTEAIGNGYARLYLSAVEGESLCLSHICRMFIASSKEKRGSMEAFLRKLDGLPSLAEKGVFPFSSEAAEAYVKEYRAAGCPMVSHSQNYRKAYHPAYRVIDSRYIPLLPVIRAVDSLLQRKGRVVMAIDGRAASGKSTAAELLAHIYEAAVIHMDDFFLPLELRTEERFREPGGNVHYERFKTEVLKPLEAGKGFSYRIFDCGICQFRGERFVKPASLTIVEGSYSTHPYFGAPYDLTVFFTVNPQEQKHRICLRNGEEMYAMFRDRWIPLEEAYFSACAIPDRCSLLVKGDCSDIV
jgi:hypothetical protein